MREQRHKELLPSDCKQLASCAAVLCAALDGLRLPPVAPGGPEHVLSVRYATEHRAGAVLRGQGLCDRVSGTGAL